MIQAGQQLTDCSAREHFLSAILVSIFHFKKQTAICAIGEVLWSSGFLLKHISALEAVYRKVFEHVDIGNF